MTKVQDPEASRGERLRTEAGRAVSMQSGLFLVPDIVSFDDSRGEIVFERLHLTGIREVLSDRRQGLDVVGRAAGTLAAIHRQLQPGDEPRGSGSDGGAIGVKREVVPLHGDFGLRNLFFVTGSDRLVVIDWANADWIGIEADFGAPEIDIAVFLISLFHRRAFSPRPISWRHEGARHFLRTYASTSPYGLDIDALRAIVGAIKPGFNRRHRRRKGSLRALGYRHSMIDLDFFLRRLSRQDFVTR